MDTTRLPIAAFDLFDEPAPQAHRSLRGKFCATDQRSDEYR